MKLPVKRQESGLFKDTRRDINELIDYCRSITVRPSGSMGVTVRHTSNGTILHAQAGKPEEPKEPSILKRYVVARVQDNHVDCHKIGNDGTVEEVLDSDGNPIYAKIAKPFNLRRAGWDGITVDYYSDETPTALSGVRIYYLYRSVVMREARIGGSTSHDIEMQVIRPAFIPLKSIIFATKVENKTGVGGVTDDLLDVNADGRAWAAVL